VRSVTIGKFLMDDYWLLGSYWCLTIDYWEVTDVWLLTIGKLLMDDLGESFRCDFGNLTDGAELIGEKDVNEERAHQTYQRWVTLSCSHESTYQCSHESTYECSHESTYQCLSNFPMSPSAPTRTETNLHEVSKRWLRRREWPGKLLSKNMRFHQLDVAKKKKNVSG